MDAQKIDELDLLRWQNAALKVEAAVAARDAVGASLLHKYGRPGETGFQIGPDGTIIRAAELTALPTEKAG